MRLGLLDNEYEVCEICPILEATEGGQEPAVWERDRLLEEYGSEIPSLEHVDIDLFNELEDAERVTRCLSYRKLGKCPLTQATKVEQ
jgi:hypothetical protein